MQRFRVTLSLGAIALFVGATSSLAPAQDRTSRDPSVLEKTLAASMRGQTSADVPSAALARLLLSARGGRSTAAHLRARPASERFTPDAFNPPELFVTDFAAGGSRGAIFDMNTKGTKVRGMYNDCQNPQGAKVDQNKILWVACTGSLQINEYLPGAAAKTLALNDTFAGISYYPIDVAIDGSGNVYAINRYSVSGATGNITYWFAAGVCNACPANGAINIAPPSVTPNGGYFIDTYRAPNNVIWADFQGCIGSNCNFGLAEIDQPQTPSRIKWQAAIPLGGMAFPGGVYETNAPVSVDVLDQQTKILTQYSTAVVPYKANFAYPAVPACDPVSFGVDKDEKHFAVADACTPAIVIGTTSPLKPRKMKWKLIKNAKFAEPIGAAYRPSDK